MAQLQSLSIQGNPVVDYITEKGDKTVDSVSWKYCKYASGKVECWCKVDKSLTFSNTNICYNPITLPFAFSDDLNFQPSGSGTSTTHIIWLGQLGLRNSNTLSSYVVSHGTATATLQCTLKYHVWGNLL